MTGNTAEDQAVAKGGNTLREKAERDRIPGSVRWDHFPFRMPEKRDGKRPEAGTGQREESTEKREGGVNQQEEAAEQPEEGGGQQERCAMLREQDPERKEENKESAKSTESNKSRKSMESTESRKNTERAGSTLQSLRESRNRPEVSILFTSFGKRAYLPQIFEEAMRNLGIRGTIYAGDCTGRIASPEAVVPVKLPPILEDGRDGRGEDEDDGSGGIQSEDREAAGEAKLEGPADAALSNVSGAGIPAAAFGKTAFADSASAGDGAVGTCGTCSPCAQSAQKSDAQGNGAQKDGEQRGGEQRDGEQRVDEQREEEQRDEEQREDLSNSSIKSWLPHRPPREQEARYVRFLLAFTKAHSIDLVIPLIDLDVWVLSRYRDDFEQQGVCLLTPDPETADLCEDKRACGKFLKAHGIPVPETAESLSAAEHMLEEGMLHFPLLVKPVHGNGSLGVFAAEDREELTLLFRRALREVLKEPKIWTGEDGWQTEDQAGILLIQQKIGVGDQDGTGCQEGQTESKGEKRETKEQEAEKRKTMRQETEKPGVGKQETGNRDRDPLSREPSALVPGSCLPPGEYGLDVICDLEGRYRETIVKRKLLMQGGETQEAVSVYAPELERLGERLALLLHPRAILDVDVMVEAGLPYVLDCNARFGGGVPFSRLSGSRLPENLLLWILAWREAHPRPGERREGAQEVSLEHASERAEKQTGCRAADQREEEMRTERTDRAEWEEAADMAGKEEKEEKKEIPAEAERAENTEKPADAEEPGREKEAGKSEMSLPYTLQNAVYKAKHNAQPVSYPEHLTPGIYGRKVVTVSRCLPADAIAFSWVHGREKIRSLLAAFGEMVTPPFSARGIDPAVLAAKIDACGFALVCTLREEKGREESEAGDWAATEESTARKAPGAGSSRENRQAPGIPIAFAYGYANDREKQGGRAVISFLAVSPAYRNLHIGERMIRICEKRAREEGMTEMAYTTSRRNSGAIRLYLRMGYEIASRKERAAFYRSARRRPKIRGEEID